MIFVYRKSLRGPVPEKWPEMLLNMSGKPLPFIVSHSLSDEESTLSLDALREKYPPPLPVVTE